MLPGLSAQGNNLDVGSTMREVIHALGLTTGLKLILDAGDNASYTSGQSWRDLSGNGYDFYRGSGSGSDGADPTFNGTPGGRSASEYFSSDGGDYFTYDSANETWMNNLHKDGATFSLAFWVFFPGATTEYLLTSISASGGPGIELACDNSQVRFRAYNASTICGLSVKSTGVNGNGWTFIGLSWNESADVVIWNVRGSAATQSGSGAYASPSASSATDTMRIGSVAGQNPLSNGDRIAFVAAWEGVALSAANLASIYSATRGKFGV